MRYLKQRPNHGITYKSSPTDTSPVAYADADFAACPDTRRSTSGFVAFWCGGPIAWQSKRQCSVAASTLEAEYISGFHAAQRTHCLRNLIHKLRHTPNPEPTCPLLDNNSVILTASADFSTPKSKHVDVKYHYFREQVKRKSVSSSHTPSNDNPADSLTETLKPGLFKKRQRLLGVEPIAVSSAATVV